MKEMRTMRRGVLFVAAPFCFFLAGCGDPKDEVIDGVTLPDIEKAGFSLQVTHTHMHMVTGNTWEYDAVTPAGTEHTTVEIPADRRAFSKPNVEATAVVRAVTLGGAKVRESTTWLGMDSTGSVWQFGKDECVYEGATCTATADSWEWAHGDARPGIVLPGGPDSDPGPYYEVYYKDHVEDVAEVLSVGEAVTVPGGSFGDCVKMQHTSKLDASVNRVIYYCPIVGIALIEEDGVKTELTHFGGV